MAWRRLLARLPAAARGHATLASAAPPLAPAARAPSSSALLALLPASVAARILAPPPRQLPPPSAAAAVRCFGSQPAAGAAAGAPPQAALGEAEFHAAADGALDALVEALEAYVEDADVADADVQYASGVLTVNLGRHGTYVVNKQTPNRQIWLSSPVSGPLRFDPAPGGRWVYRRDGRDLVHQLEQEIGGLVGRPLSLD